MRIAGGGPIILIAVKQQQAGAYDHQDHREYLGLGGMDETPVVLIVHTDLFDQETLHAYHDQVSAKHLQRTGEALAHRPKHKKQEHAYYGLVNGCGENAYGQYIAILSRAALYGHAFM